MILSQTHRILDFAGVPLARLGEFQAVLEQTSNRKSKIQNSKRGRFFVEQFAKLFRNGAINLQLSAWHCAWLATACWMTGEETDGEERDDWRLLALLMQASAQAGYARQQMSPADEAALDEQLRLAGLETLNRQWERETVEESSFIQTLIAASYKRGRQESKQKNGPVDLYRTLSQCFGTALKGIAGRFSLK